MEATNPDWIRFVGSDFDTGKLDYNSTGLAKMHLKVFTEKMSRPGSKSTTIMSN
jgi:hypothetical protein